MNELVIAAILWSAVLLHSKVKTNAAEVLRAENRKLKARAENAEDGYLLLQSRWNKLVRQINAKGGQEFLDGTMETKQFSPDEIRLLIKLCHPDKHAGNEEATVITRKLLKLR